MSQDLQQRAHRFDLFVVAFPNGPVRIGRPGQYFDFADRAAAAAALDLLDLVVPKTPANSAAQFGDIFGAVKA